MKKKLLRENVIQAQANVDDIVRAVGFRRLRDEFKVGKCVVRIKECLATALKIIGDNYDETENEKE